MEKKITCKTGLKNNILNKKVFDRETTLCRKLSKKNKGKCGWGTCKDCGVIPLIIKLHKGILLEYPEDIRKEKAKVIS